MFVISLFRFPSKSIVFLSRTMAKQTPNPAKMQLRDEVADRIAKLTTEEKKRQSEIVYNKIINHPWYKSANRISLFMSTDGEINTAPIIAHVKAKGAIAFVPQYVGGKMRMLRLEPDDDENTMFITKHGIAQHAKTQVREDALETGGLDLIIAPGVAFSKAGDRCGHGGGYYDRYISGLRSNPETAPKVMAVAFNCQVVDHVPTNEFDQKVDEVIFAE
uniref:5-formyltetrahydrofolate cyclo-ligase n=1 Tax=Heliothis virescens TaxID=7102 RepID=A0A2A4IWE7_HELVI